MLPFPLTDRATLWDVPPSHFIKDDHHPKNAVMNWCWLRRPTFEIDILKDDHVAAESAAGQDGHNRIMASTRDERHSRLHPEVAARDGAR